MPEVEQLEDLILVLDSVVIALEQVLRGDALVGGTGFCSVAGTDGLNSVTPSTLTTSTEWCAAIARPDSLTMFGCGT